MFEKEPDKSERSLTRTVGAGQPAEAAALLGHALEVVIGSMTAKALGPLEEQARRLQLQLSKLHDELRPIRDAQQAMAAKLEGIIAQNRLLERASEEHARLSQEHYQEHIIAPMVRLLLPVVDALEETAKQDPCHDQSPGEAAVSSVIEQIGTYLTQFLSSYGIEQVRHQPGAVFDPKLMKPIRFITSGRKELTGRVAASMQMGFRQGIDRVLRFESVALYHYPSEEPLRVS
jgi:molecular chaperone GrpE (heat shock protein)